MRVDSKQIIAERKKRAWSQDQLAQVSGLGVRTIQRIESCSSASNESVKAIAASFEVDLDALIDEPPSDRVTRSVSLRPLTALGFVGAVLTGSAALVSTQSFAEQIMLDVGIAVNSEPAHEGSLLTRDGKEAEMRLDESLRFIITPEIQDDGRVFLTTQIFSFDMGEYKLVGEPKLLTGNNKEAEIRMTMKNGDEVRFQVTPHADQ